MGVYKKVRYFVKFIGQALTLPGHAMPAARGTASVADLTASQVSKENPTLPIQSHQELEIPHNITKDNKQGKVRSTTGDNLEAEAMVDGSNECTV